MNKIDDKTLLSNKSLSVQYFMMIDKQKLHLLQGETKVSFL